MLGSNYPRFHAGWPSRCARDAVELPSVAMMMHDSLKEGQCHSITSDDRSRTVVVTVHIAEGCS